MTEREVLDVLGIENFRQMTKEKVVSFASMINEMDPEVAMKALEQFPEFAKTIVALATDFKGILEHSVTTNIELAKASIAVCQSVIDCLSAQVTQVQSFEEKKYYLALMRELSTDVCGYAAQCQKENNLLTEKAGIVIGILIGLLASALGMRSHVKMTR